MQEIIIKVKDQLANGFHKNLKLNSRKLIKEIIKITIKVLIQFFLFKFQKVKLIMW